MNLNKEFEEEYNKNLDDFFIKNKEMSKIEIILHLVLPIPLKKVLLKPSRLCLLMLYPLLIAMLSFPILISYTTNDRLLTLMFSMVAFLFFLILIVFCRPLLMSMYYILLTRKKLLSTLFKHQKASQRLIDIVEQNCNEKYKTEIMYELLYNNSPFWERGTYGRLKGFFYNETFGDTEFMKDIERMAQELRLQIGELKSQKEAWEELKVLEGTLSATKKVVKRL